MAWYTLFALTTVLMLNSAKRSKKAKQLTAQVSSLEAEMKQRQKDFDNSTKEAHALFLPKPGKGTFFFFCCVRFIFPLSSFCKPLGTCDSDG